MSERIVELTLPEFAFVEGSGHVRPNVLFGRNVILHTRTASVVEVLEWKMSAIKPEKMQQRFVYRNRYGLEPRWTRWKTGKRFSSGSSSRPSSGIATIAIGKTGTLKWNIMERTTEYRAEVGRQLAELRAKRRLTAQQVADLSGVNRVNITKIERGSYNVSIDILGRVCDALGAELKIVER